MGLPSHEEEEDEAPSKSKMAMKKKATKALPAASTVVREAKPSMLASAGGERRTGQSRPSAAALPSLSSDGKAPSVTRPSVSSSLAPTSHRNTVVVARGKEPSMFREEEGDGQPSASPVDSANTTDMMRRATEPASVKLVASPPPQDKKGGWPGGAPDTTLQTAAKSTVNAERPIVNRGGGGGVTKARSEVTESNMAVDRDATSNAMKRPMLQQQRAVASKVRNDDSAYDSDSSGGPSSVPPPPRGSGGGWGKQNSLNDDDDDDQREAREEPVAREVQAYSKRQAPSKVMAQRRTSAAAAPQQAAYASPQAASGSSRYEVVASAPLLGSGGFGVVYAAHDLLTMQPVAIKETRIAGVSNVAQLQKDLEEEARTLMALVHPHIVGVLDFTFDDRTCAARLVMEWMPGGSVAGLLKKAGFRLHEGTARRILHDALTALAFVHQKGVIHRDIKPANLLLTADNVVKLSDFGSSKVSDAASQGTMSQHVVGTPCYLAPECITAGTYSVGSDIWAWAATAVELTTGLPPWSHLPMQQQHPVPLMFAIGTHVDHPRIPDHVSQSLRQLLDSCFARDLGARPTASQLLQHEYFRKGSPLPADAETPDAFFSKRSSSSTSTVVGGGQAVSSYSSDLPSQNAADSSSVSFATTISMTL